MRESIAGVVGFSLNANLTASEMSRWSPERIKMLCDGMTLIRRAMSDDAWKAAIAETKEIKRNAEA